MEVIIVQGLKQLPQAKEIREAVFVIEQGFEDEFDHIDELAWHVLIKIEDCSLGVGRVFMSDQDQNTYIIGRVAVLKKYRGQSIGRRIMHELENQAKRCGAKKVELSAQVSAIQFYEKIGYVAQGETYLDQFCPHIKMVKDL